MRCMSLLFPECMTVIAAIDVGKKCEPAGASQPTGGSVTLSKPEMESASLCLALESSAPSTELMTYT